MLLLSQDAFRDSPEDIPRTSAPHSLRPETRAGPPQDGWPFLSANLHPLLKLESQTRSPRHTPADLTVPTEKGDAAISCLMGKLRLEKPGNLPKITAEKFETCSGAPIPSEILKNPSEEGVSTHVRGTRREHLTSHSSLGARQGCTFHMGALTPGQCYGTLSRSLGSHLLVRGAVGWQVRPQSSPGRKRRQLTNSWRVVSPASSG